MTRGDYCFVFVVSAGRGNKTGCLALMRQPGGLVIERADNTHYRCILARIKLDVHQPDDVVPAAAEAQGFNTIALDGGVVAARDTAVPAV